MARTVAKYVLAALLALLATQGAPASYVLSPAAFSQLQTSTECGAEAEEQPSVQTACDVAAPAAVLDPPPYVSRRRAEPHTPSRFQRPPPLFSLHA